MGSVEEPLVGIVSESEAKKHKLRVLQVERGVSFPASSYSVLSRFIHVFLVSIQGRLA